MTTHRLGDAPGSLVDATGRNPVAKALSLLNHMVDSEETTWTARSLAAELGAPVSSVHRTLVALMRAGVLVQDAETAVYEFSVEFHRIARRVITRFPFPELAREHLAEVAHVTGETTLLGLLDGHNDRMSFVSQVEGGHPLRYVIPLNKWVSLATGASGLAILAFLDRDRREAVIDDHLASGAESTRAELEDEIELIRARGYAISHGKRISGATGIAAPVFGADGEVIGDLVISMPYVRFMDGKEAEFAAITLERADALTSLLGGTPRPRREI